MKFTVGKDYKTYGGWLARCIWVGVKGYVAWFVHKPGDQEDESMPCGHTMANGKAWAEMSWNEPPRYDSHHPADIVSGDDE